MEGPYQPRWLAREPFDLFRQRDGLRGLPVQELPLRLEGRICKGHGIYRADSVLDTLVHARRSGRRI